MDESTDRRRGRPSKFGRPSQVVAITLPDDVLDRLRRVHRDLGWAIVKLVDAQTVAPTSRRKEPDPDVELVTVADRRSLIVVNREVIRNIPGVNIIALSGNRAFLALDTGRGMSDLELAVHDRLGEPNVAPEERKPLENLQRQLKAWRHDDALRFHTRAIIVVERLVKKSSDRQSTEASAARRATPRSRGAVPPPPN